MFSEKLAILKSNLEIIHAKVNCVGIWDLNGDQRNAITGDDVLAVPPHGYIFPSHFDDGGLAEGNRLGNA